MDTDRTINRIPDLDTMVFFRQSTENSVMKHCYINWLSSWTVQWYLFNELIQKWICNKCLSWLGRRLADPTVLETLGVNFRHPAGPLGPATPHEKDKFLWPKSRLFASYLGDFPLNFGRFYLVVCPEFCVNGVKVWHLWIINIQLFNSVFSVNRRKSGATLDEKKHFTPNLVQVG